MNEIVWFWAFCWFCLLGLGYATKTYELKILGTVIGMILGLINFEESALLAVVLVFGNMALFLRIASELK